MIDLGEYRQFVGTKTTKQEAAGFKPELSEYSLFDFQEAIASWACMRGRSAIFADTGLGKTIMQLSWADQVAKHTGGRVLVLAPLAVASMYRMLKPGRLMAVHCMNLPTSKVNDGYIGIRDFRGDLIRCFQDKGFIYHSEVCIWKDPVVAMQRTKALGLLHKQIKKDSCMSRQGIPDYLVVMRKPGVNESPVSGEFTHFVGDELMNNFIEDNRDDGRVAQSPNKDKGATSIDVWQRYASPIWHDINQTRTLNYRPGRHADDERHICPLQLDVIERAMQMWTNQGDVVFTPFLGIGSEAYVAVKMGRKAIGVELKESYFDLACKNMEDASKTQYDMFG